jgi:hypothetical protein
VNVLEALADRNLFASLPAFRDLESWSSWRAFLAAVYGLPMSSAELEVFRAHTGVRTPRPGGYSESVCIVGRQSGKTRIAAMLAVFEAITATEEAGAELSALLVAQDHRAALRTLLKYAAAPFDLVPMLARAVVTRTADTIALENGVALSAYPCRPQALRGLRARVAVCDELAFFRSSEGFPVDLEMLRALRPTLATTGGKLIVLSSPYGQTGALWHLHRKHYGRDDSTTLVWQASAPAMNPTLPADYLARMEQDDPEAYRSEVLGEFRAGLSTFFAADSLGACVVPGRRELLPVDGVEYVAFTDPSGGGSDAFTLAVAHRSGERIVVDCLRTWLPAFNPAGVVAEAAALLKTYRCREVTGDRYAGEWPPSTARRFTLRCCPP